MEEHAAQGQLTLSLRDLFVWTFLCGLMIGAERFSTPWLEPSEIHFALWAAQMIKALCLGTGLFAFYRFSRQPKEAMFSTWQPGHWLLCLIGVLAPWHLLNVAWDYHYYCFQTPAPFGEFQIYFVVSGCLTITAWIALLGVGLLLPVRPRYWWIMLFRFTVFLGMIIYAQIWTAFDSTFPGLSLLLRWFPWNYPLGLAYLIVLSILDGWQNGRHRDAVHWIGILAMGAWFLPEAIRVIGKTFFG
ncbi:hypothetical protein DTL42_07405 [Bremerella cremea]|uniref:Uncharacterized protein n=1 Tax=Bremerella cremea TaxID=1031537 RepID=A0A368KSW1_9BACT|nr:hypothetical protein [Bremerella cremea]RCS52658.1 hypothetical protein DTL42_07405 [Bremerella cremea]